MCARDADLTPPARSAVSVMRPSAVPTRRPRLSTTPFAVIKPVSVVMERSVTLLNCDDLDKGERRQFRLDRIVSAELA